MSNELEPQKGDNNLHYLASLLNLFPVVGGMLCSLATIHIPNHRVERIETFTKKIAADLESVSEKIDEEYVKSEEFGMIFQKTYQGVSNTHRQEKLTLYQNLLTKSFTTKPNIDRIENYLRAIDNLTATDIRVLSAFLKTDLEIQAITRGQYDSMGSLIGTLKKLLPDIDEEEIKNSVRRLDQENITTNVSGSLMMTMSGVGATSLNGRLSNYGRGFVEYVMQN